jgi:hypothetical protein
MGYSEVKRAMPRRPARRAYSLLEVVMASAICATALVPALAFMRDGMTLATTIDTKHMLLTYAVSKMEEQLAIFAATWAEGNISGDFAADGNANIRFAVTSSDAPASGGIDSRLMNVSVTTYSDDDNDDTMDAAEARITVTTKISKLVTYEDNASS